MRITSEVKNPANVLSFFAFPPAINPPMNTAIKESNVIELVNIDSWIARKRKKIETAKLHIILMEKYVVTPYKTEEGIVLFTALILPIKHFQNKLFTLLI
jgi:hypothetical protein